MEKPKKKTRKKKEEKIGRNECVDVTESPFTILKIL